MNIPKSFVVEHHVIEDLFSVDAGQMVSEGKIFTADKNKELFAIVLF